jgi:hypothetical protein
MQPCLPQAEETGAAVRALSEALEQRGLARRGAFPTPGGRCRRAELSLAEPGLRAWSGVTRLTW